MFSYKPVLSNVQEEDEDADGIFTIDDDDDDERNSVMEEGNAHMEPMEIESGTFEDAEGAGSYGQDGPLFTWTEPWVASVTITLGVVTPILLGNIWTFYHLVGRIWATTPFCLHLLISLATARSLIPTTPDKLPSRILSSVAPLLDIFLFSVHGYNDVYSILNQWFFTEIDGTDVVEYTYCKRRFEIYMSLGIAIACCRVLIGGTAVSLRFAAWALPSAWTSAPGLCKAPRLCSTFFERIALSLDGKERLKRWLRRVLTCLVVLSALLALWSIFSIAAHFIPWSPPTVNNAECDPLDETECSLPFPSFHQTRLDPTTPTGYRVDLKSHVLPPLKGGIRMDPTFLNELDGFSTMAPMLFYMEGLKEAHERGKSAVKLQGPANIADSVTSTSVTLLLDVGSGELIPHSAEIDYLDQKRPLVMVFPSRPLQHGGHYAVAVINASDENGDRLPPTRGMTALLRQDDSSDRQTRYRNLIIPTFERAAPWFSFAADPQSLQLLFDFPTVSEDYQLGPIRSVRDATLKHIETPEWGSWQDHVRVNRIIDNDCEQDSTLIARTVHAELDIPWFLSSYGSGQRGAFLDDAAVTSGRPTTVGTGKFVVHIPCSVRAAALGIEGAKPLRATMEYGHGLFYNRDEASDDVLKTTANDEGYILTAMDWRGMSSYDLLLVAKVLLSTPRLFQAVRDNLIQGYASKYCLQHFTRNEMLSMDWFTFESSRVPRLDDKPPISVFYGNSQGGILGAGYTALSGTTGLIDRSVLGVPGSPFALIMTRSLEFKGYDNLLLVNFYSNRHVRILLCLVQMAWDPTEGSGTLATPVTEPFPPILMQAGLGDATVPTIAAEALARGFGAHTLPNSPRKIFGVPVTNETYSPHVTLTELLYEEEYLTLPADDWFAARNSVHYCVRKDAAMIDQMKTFINTGQVTDPCITDSCHRLEAEC